MTSGIKVESNSGGADNIWLKEGSGAQISLGGGKDTIRVDANDVSNFTLEDFSDGDEIFFYDASGNRAEISEIGTITGGSFAERDVGA